VRFTLTAMAAMGRDLKLSKERIAGYRNFTTKLWNAARFAEMNEATGSDGALPTPTATVNKWIIGETAKARVTVDEALENFRFNDAANTLYAFVWGTFCDWYVEFSKPLLMDGDDETRAETQATMAWVIDQCLILLHPIMPFVTEELWGTLGARPKMLVHADWPSYGADSVDPAADREMNWVISLIEQIRSARAQMHVPAGLHVPLLASELNEAGRAAWAQASGADREPHRCGCLPKGLRHRDRRGRQLWPAAGRYHRRGRGEGAAGEDAGQARKRTERVARAAEEPEIRRKRARGRGDGNPREPCPA